MQPGQAARRPARPHRRSARRSANAYLKVDTSAGAGRGDRRPDDPVPRHRRPLHAQRRDRASRRSTRTRRPRPTNPAVTLRSVGSSGGQAAAFTYDLARSVVYTRQGNPAWAGQERDGVAGIRPDDMFYGARPATSARLDRHEQDRDPAGRRAAAAARQPDHADGARQAAAAALLVPAARREGGRRDERRRPLARLHARRHRSPLRPLQAAEPARLRRRELGVRALDVVRLSRTASLTNAQAAALHRRRLRGRAAPASSRSCPTTVADASPARRRLRHAARAVRRPSTRASRRPSRAAPTASTGPTGRPRPKIELARGIRMDANYYHYPGSLDRRRSPGFLNGGGFPMRFADTRRHADRRLPGEHEHHRRVEPAAAGDDRHAARQRARAARLLRRLRHQHAHRQPGAAAPDEDAIVASAQARGVPVISYKQLLDWTDGRNDSTIRSLNWSAGTLTLHHRRRRGRERPADDAADPGPERDADRDHARRLSRRLHRADDQGHPVRDVRRVERARSPRRTRRRAVARSRPRRRSAVVPLT